MTLKSTQRTKRRVQRDELWKAKFVQARLLGVSKDNLALFKESSWRSIHYLQIFINKATK